MPIRCGNAAVSKVYCGSEQVARVYCGEDLVFGTTDANFVDIVVVTSLEKTGAAIVGRSGAGLVGTSTSGVIFGGFTTSYSNDFYKYDVGINETVSLTLLTKSGATILARDAMGMVGAPSGGLIFGGNSGTRRNDFYRFVVAANTVKVTALTKSGANISARNEMGMAGDSVAGLICGGRSASSWFNDFYRYNVTNNNVAITALTKSGAITPRSGFGIIGDASSGIIFGGYDGTTIRNDFFSYSVSGSIVTLTPITLTGDTIRTRYFFGIAGTSQNGIIFGGSPMQGTYLNDFYGYSISGDTATITDLLEAGDYIAARTHLGMAGNATAGAIYGGWDGSNRLNGLFNYSTRRVPLSLAPQIMATVSSPSVSGTQPPALDQLSMAGTVTNWLLFGGRSSGTGFSDTFYLGNVTGSTANFLRLTTVGSIAARFSTAMTGDTSNGVIFGGQGSGGALSDFNIYSVSGNNVTVTPYAQTVISARKGVGIVGDATTGIIYGGVNDATSPAVALNDFYRYSVGPSSVTINALTKAGDAIPGRAFSAMAGSVTSGIIYGGHSVVGPVTYHTDFYRYSIAGNVVTLKKLTVVGINRPGTIAFGLLGDENAGVIFGGWTSSMHLSTVHAYKVTGDYIHIKELTSSSSTTRSYFGYVGTSSDFSLFGGFNSTWQRQQNYARFTIT